MVFATESAMLTAAPQSVSSSNLVVFFDQPELGTVSRVGGKGSNLIALRTAGFPVPPGFVVVAGAYQLFLEGIDWLGSELSAFDYQHPEILQEQCARLRARLSQVPLPAAIQEEARIALQHLGSDAL